MRIANVSVDLIIDLKVFNLAVGSETIIYFDVVRNSKTSKQIILLSWSAYKNQVEKKQELHILTFNSLWAWSMLYPFSTR